MDFSFDFKLHLFSLRLAVRSNDLCEFILILQFSIRILFSFFLKYRLRININYRLILERLLLPQKKNLQQSVSVRVI